MQRKDATILGENPTQATSMETVILVLELTARPVTGILILKILVPRTEIFSGKMVSQDPFFR